MRRVWILVASVGATAVLVAIAFFLGAWAFETRRSLTHEARLERLAARQPTLLQVVQGLTGEGAVLLAAPRGEEQLGKVARERGRDRAKDVVSKGERWPITRVFQEGDMIYFVFCDANGVRRDYLCVAR